MENILWLITKNSRLFSNCLHLLEEKSYLVICGLVFGGVFAGCSEHAKLTQFGGLPLRLVSLNKKDLVWRIIKYLMLLLFLDSKNFLGFIRFEKYSNNFLLFFSTKVGGKKAV